MVEIIPKPEEKIPIWQNILFYLSLLLLLGAVVSYFLLNVYIEESKITVENLKEAISREKTAEERIIEEEILGYQEKIGNFVQLVSKHLFPSRIFEFIEKNTHPEVWFSAVEINSESGQIKLVGQTENFITLAQQIQIFREKTKEDNPKVKDFYLTNINIGKEGKVNFNLNLNLNLGFLNE